MALRRHLIGWSLAALAVTSVTFAQDANRTVLIFLDDLHIGFQNTPKLRTGLVQSTERLLAAGRAVAMVSDGPSSVTIPPTTERTPLLQVANRILGAGLKASETANPTPSITRDVRRRQADAETTLQDAVSTLRLTGIVYVTERTVQLGGVSIPIVVTRPEGMEAAVAELLAVN
jgi:hypothetical protein